jgi:hypothetical protein
MCAVTKQNIVTNRTIKRWALCKQDNKEHIDNIRHYSPFFRSVYSKSLSCSFYLRQYMIKKRLRHEYYIYMASIKIFLFIV